MIVPLAVLLFFTSVTDAARAVWALNAGGAGHRSVDGVVYNADSDIPGTTSDHGVHHIPLLARVHPQDRILYQTERYHYEDFGYDIPIPRDGQYVLNLKFSEVYFKSPNQKVFDVHLNKQPVIVGLDIFSKVGYGTAHDEYVQFTIQDQALLIGNYKLAFEGTLRVEFVKTPYDNPKINAIVLYEGLVKDVPKLPPLQVVEDDIVQDEIIQEEPKAPEPAPAKEAPAPPPTQQQQQAPPSHTTSDKKRIARPKKANPYQQTDNSQYWPIIISIGVFFPTVILLYNRQKAG